MTMNSAHEKPIFHNAGDSGLLIEFGTGFNERVNNAVIAFETAVQNLKLKGMVETTPSIKSVLVRFDPLTLYPAKLRDHLSDLIGSRNWMAAEPPASRKRWRIPALYGGAAGPDLAEMATLMGLSEAATIESHASARQRIYMIGFAPGQAYLGLLGPEWDIPRLTKINPNTPTGSILTALRQTNLYARPNPTGWRVIGRSPFRSFLPESGQPFKLAAGDEVIFEPINATEYKRLDDQTRRGACVASSEALS